MNPHVPLFVGSFWKGKKKKGNKEVVNFGAMNPYFKFLPTLDFVKKFVADIQIPTHLKDNNTQI